MKFHKKFISEKIKAISEEKKVLDMGGGKKFQKWLKEYEHLFKNCDFKTMDYDKSTGADLIGDIHNIPLPNESIDAIICSSVLEHIENPIKAVEEMKRILKKGGKIFVYIPSIYPYHAKKGSYPDYWRFFDDTVNLLFKNFAHIEIEKRGGYFKALSFFVPLQHKIQFILKPIANFLDVIFNTKEKTTTAGYYIYAKK